MSSDLPHLVFVVGPTACGKSDFAVEASVRSPALGKLQPEIINCDSIQFFEGVDIGAAKPSEELLARATHHLISHVAKGEKYNAGDFRRDALTVIHERSLSGCQRFLAVGGSGFYIQALEKGMFDVPDIPEEIKEDLTKELEGKGLEFLHRELVRRDPDSGKRIQPADKYRILRALEILRADPENRTLSEIKEHFDRHREAPPFRVSKLGLFRQRDVLRERVIERTRNMLKNGLVNEVHALRLEGLGSWNPMQSVGYAEVQAMLDGYLPEELLVDAIVTSTMQLAKRQMTWFKKDASIQWFDVEAGLDGPLEAAKRLLDS